MAGLQQFQEDDADYRAKLGKYWLTYMRSIHPLLPRCITLSHKFGCEIPTFSFRPPSCNYLGELVGPRRLCEYEPLDLYTISIIKVSMDRGRNYLTSTNNCTITLVDYINPMANTLLVRQMGLPCSLLVGQDSRLVILSCRTMYWMEKLER